MLGELREPKHQSEWGRSNVQLDVIHVWCVCARASLAITELSHQGAESAPEPGNFMPQT